MDKREVFISAEIRKEDVPAFVTRLLRYQQIHAYYGEAPPTLDALHNIDDDSALSVYWRQAFQLAQFVAKQPAILSYLEVPASTFVFPIGSEQTFLTVYKQSQQKEKLLQDIRACCDAAIRYRYEHKELNAVADDAVVQALDRIVDRDPTIPPSFVESIKKSSTREEFPGYLFDATMVSDRAQMSEEEFISSAPGEDFILGLRTGLTDGINETDVLDNLLDQCQDGTRGALELMKLEATLMGVLLGRKRVQHEESYIPTVTKQENDAFLRVIDTAVIRMYPAFDTETHREFVAESMFARE